MSCKQSPFLLQQILFLISRINPAFTQEIAAFIKGDYSNLKHFKKCIDTAGSIIKKL